jgi:hypothetical protein
VTPEQLAAARARATRPRHTVPIVLDGTLRQRIEQAEAEINPTSEASTVEDRRLNGRTRKADVADTAAAEARLAALRDDAASVTLHVVVEAIPRTPYRQLVSDHPARSVDGKVHPDDGLGLNYETFPPALAKACIIGHKPDPDGDTVDPLDAEYVAWLVDEFATDRQVQNLSNAAFDANRGNDAIPLPQLPSTTRTSEGA